ncbi:MAG TPA: hypothetical protein VF677_12105 [Flavobacterium sp.]
MMHNNIIKEILLLITLTLLPGYVSSQSGEQKFLLIFSEIKQETKIDKYKVSLKAIKYDPSGGELKDNFKILNIAFNGFTDAHFEACQKGDSIHLMYVYNTDTFNIDNTYGGTNSEQINKILKNKKKLFSITVKSNKIIQSKIDYSYVLVKCTACSRILDSYTLDFKGINNNSVLLIKNNIEEIPNFEIDKGSAYKIYKSLIIQ